MVYRGKPSAGCENCRKAKKRCGLEQPACSRCVKLKKTCSGYRDTSQLQIQDETFAVKQKAERQKEKAQHLKPTKTETVSGMLTPGSTPSDSSSSSNETMELDMPASEASVALIPADGLHGGVDWSAAALMFALRPKAEDVATTYFMQQFTSQYHWTFMRSFAELPEANVDPCLSLAIKACGLAALDNVRAVVLGRHYARSMYGQALSLLNEALRDPRRSRTDESLIAVVMLGYFENLTCEGRQSIQSWKEHIKGATQLLKLRGKEQFKTKTGRLLFRETRAQIMIHCIWDDLEPPAFLWEYQLALEDEPNDVTLVKPIDDLTWICFDFATLKANACQKKITDQQAAEQASELERRFIQWQIDTTAFHERWRYYEIDVADSEHVWDGKVHAYSGHPAPSVWNTWRGVRIFLTRFQEGLCKKFEFSEAERDEQMQYFRKIRRQMTDDICATIPVSLGHAYPAYCSPCVLITAYGAIWPLFFAGQCLLERVGPDALPILMGESPRPGQRALAAAAQAKWVMGRLEYISMNVGLKWADGIVATLRGDFQTQVSKYKTVSDIWSASPEGGETDVEELMNLYRARRAPWVREIEDANRGARYLLEKPSPLSDAITEELAQNQGHPIWFGRDVAPNSQHV